MLFRTPIFKMLLHTIQSISTPEGLIFYSKQIHHHTVTHNG